MSDIQYFMPMYERLKPVTPWTGGRVAEVELVTLSEAAIMATMQAGETVTIGDILRASGRGEIFLNAIIHRGARLVACRAGDAVLNDGLAPEGAIPTLPLAACRALANTGRASWRTFDGLQDIDGVLHHFTKWALVEDEPDFETSLEDCRIKRCEVHALADAFKPVDNTQPQAATPTPPVMQAPASETPKQRRARLLEWFDSYKGEHGAKQRVFEREKLLNPKADRSDIRKQIEKAQTERAEKKRGGGWTSQLVQDGKR